MIDDDPEPSLAREVLRVLLFGTLIGVCLFIGYLASSVLY